MLYRFFFANLYGILFTTMGLYYGSNYIFDVEPFGVNDGIIWLSNQSETAITSILSALITIIGFLIAYATATSNWRGQLLAELKLQAADDIESFFSLASKITTDCKIFAEYLIESLHEYNSTQSFQDLEFTILHIANQRDKFIQNRQQLVAMGIESYRFQGKYANILALNPNLMHDMLTAINCLNNITEKIWFSVPYLSNPTQQNFKMLFEQINENECKDFCETVEINSQQLHFTFGGVRGHLLSTVVPLNVWSIYHLYKSRRDVHNAIISRYNFHKKHG
jgi:hypothetical protein